MMHSPIQLRDVALSFRHKICFEGFTTQIEYGSRIAIIGQNGCGKSTLLKMLQGNVEPTSGKIKIPSCVNIGYVPQMIECFEKLSGGQRFNKAFTQALSANPNVLLLDEPTNHLDLINRKSLMRLLNAYQGTLIIVTHDVEVLQNCVDSLWHIDNSKVHLFSGNYNDYIRESQIKRSALEDERILLHRQKQDMHQALMKEQNRASKSRAKGEKSITNRKWPTIVSKAKVGRALETSNRKKRDIANKKQALKERLSDLNLPQIINPKFSLCAKDMGEGTIVAINDGSLGYGEETVLHNVSLSICSHERIAIMGRNGSGKSTLIKAILNDIKITKSGYWHLPKRQDIGYLDQQYGTLTPEKSVLEIIQQLMPAKSHAEIRYHLNDFLFRKNDEVHALVSTLSGGEKVRLSLAQIAAQTPKLLILDEITNNLDLTTREHVIQVLQKYPGAMIVISHDEDFLRAININESYTIKNRSLYYLPRNNMRSY